MKIGGSEDLFRLQYQLPTSQFSGLRRLIRAFPIRPLKLAALSCLTVLAVLGSIFVTGAPPRPGSPVRPGGHARSARLGRSSGKSIQLSSVSKKLRRRHKHHTPVTMTTADKLRNAFAAFYHIAPRDVGTVVAGSLHVASDRAHNGFWATAELRPSGRIPSRVAIDFQDGGNIGIFRSRDDISWHMSGVGGEPFPCPARVPSGMLAAWGLAPSPLCANHARQHGAPRPRVPLPAPGGGVRTIAEVAESQVGVGDTPASQSFSGPDCDPYTAMVGQRPGSARCGVNARFRVRDQNEFWCSDFAKWVWRRAGVRSGLGTLNPAAASFYPWARAHGQRPRFGSHAPAVGDAVVFYPPWAPGPNGRYADHVGIVVAVNSNGTVDLVNGDFGGGGVPITVERNDNIAIASWASQVWNRGEKWIFVSPGPVRPPRPPATPSAPPSPSPVTPSTPPPSAPAITSFTASSSVLPSTGGHVTLAVSASQATSYSFASSRSGPTGLTSVPSDSGRASDTVTIPPNATGRPVSYTFDVTVVGPGGTATSAVSVTVSTSVPAATQPRQAHTGAGRCLRRHPDPDLGVRG
jgi:hypothetical protein